MSSALLHAFESACDGGMLACVQRGSSDEKAAGPSTRKRQASRKRRALLDILEQVLQPPYRAVLPSWPSGQQCSALMQVSKPCKANFTMNILGCPCLMTMA